MGEKKDHWSSEAYASSASFVPQLTTRVVTLLAAKEGERILDLGCGDGTLTATLSDKVGPHGGVVGADSSGAMIASAADKFARANTTYVVADGTALLSSPSPGPEEGKPISPGAFDAVFSNAALHWILRRPDTRAAVFASCLSALRPGGRFVFEMGGAGNVAEVHAATVGALVSAGGLELGAARESIPWFFPSEAWVRATLASVGFEVERVETEYRPTKLNPENEDGTGGLEGWIRLMCAPSLAVVADGAKRDDVVRTVVETLKGVITREEDGSQWIGYVRLRAVAVKPIAP